MKQQLLKAFSLGLITASLSATSLAGAVSTGNVVIDDSLKSARGSASQVRNSRDRKELIYCQTISVGGGAAVQLNCTARNTAGTTRRCVSNNVGMINEFKSIDSNSYIYFRWDDEGKCTVMQIANGSFFGRKGS